ncbi:MAG: hypothetical protein CMA56_02490 [Euryarchaeota archaeon]|nr:hypothetical protein [Euryarchaeota archaeon]|tara:strand:- start:1642 stop:2205 length:564 start_codon:yes stop_codon:yes gene_type:complete
MQAQRSRPLFDARASSTAKACTSNVGHAGPSFAVGFLRGVAASTFMLPDTLHKLPQEERFAYAKVLAFMTRVDDELTVDEMAMFEQRLGTALLSPNQRKSIRSALKVPPPLEECLQELGPEAGRLALRDSVLMAAADGNVDEDELEALRDIADHLGLNEDAVDRLLKWTEEGYAWMNEGYALLNDLA